MNILRWQIRPQTANVCNLQKVLDRIKAETLADSFDYARFFPGSKNAAKLDQPVSRVAGQSPISEVASAKTSPSDERITPRFSEFAETWYQEKVVEWGASHRTTIRATLDGHLIPRFGEKEVGQITKADILAFRADLAKVQARGKQTV